MSITMLVLRCMISEQFQQKTRVLIGGRCSCIRAHETIKESCEGRDVYIDKIVDQLLRFLGSAHGIPLQRMSECADGKVEYEGVRQLLGRWRFQTAQLENTRGHLKYDVQELVEQFLRDRFMLAKNSHFFRGEILAELPKIFGEVTRALHHFGKLLRGALDLERPIAFGLICDGINADGGYILASRCGFPESDLLQFFYRYQRLVHTGSSFSRHRRSTASGHGVLA